MSAFSTLNQTSPLYSPVCLEDTVVFTCIASGTGSTYWKVNEGVVHRFYNVTQSDTIESFTINVVEINGTTVVSNAIVQRVTLQLNGANISCSAYLQGPYITQSINIAGNFSLAVLVTYHLLTLQVHQI